MYEEYTLKANRSEIKAGIRYTVFYKSPSGSESKLSENDNKALYDVLDDALWILLGILARQQKTAIVKIRLNCPLSEGAKRMLCDKYGGELNFASLTFI